MSKVGLHLVLNTEAVDLPAGLEAIELETIALAVEIADEEAQIVVRSYGTSSAHEGATAYTEPTRNPSARRDFARAADYLVRRGIARRRTAKSVVL